MSAYFCGGLYLVGVLFGILFFIGANHKKMPKPDGKP